MNKKIEFYQTTIKIWNDLCDLHKKLFELTSEEYIHLLSGNVEKVESSIKEKELLISEISTYEEKRKTIVDEINNVEQKSIDNFFQLNKYFGDLEIEQNNKHLDKFNHILKEIILNIQKQNKTNQLFINKAIISLDKIKTAGSSTKNYSLYNKNGALNK